MIDNFEIGILECDDFVFQDRNGFIEDIGTRDVTFGGNAEKEGIRFSVFVSEVVSFAFDGVELISKVFNGGFFFVSIDIFLEFFVCGFFVYHKFDGHVANHSERGGYLRGIKGCYGIYYKFG